MPAQLLQFLITSTSSGLSSPSLFFQPLSKAGSPARRVLRQAREPSRAGGLQQQELQELDGIPGAALLQVSVMVDPPPQDCLLWWAILNLDINNAHTLVETLFFYMSVFVTHSGFIIIHLQLLWGPLCDYVLRCVLTCGTGRRRCATFSFFALFSTKLILPFVDLPFSYLPGL